MLENEEAYEIRAPQRLLISSNVINAQLRISFNSLNNDLVIFYLQTFYRLLVLTAGRTMFITTACYYQKDGFLKIKR